MKTFNEWLKIHNEGLSSLEHLMLTVPDNLRHIAKLCLDGEIATSALPVLFSRMGMTRRQIEFWSRKIASFLDTPRPKANPNRIDIPIQPDEIRVNMRDPETRPERSLKRGYGPIQMPRD